MAEKPALYGVLRDILGDVNHWLQFAEAKNAALVTLNLAVIVGVGTIATTGTNLPDHFGGIALILCLGLTASLVISASSFFPNLLEFLDPDIVADYSGNAFYFKDLATASAAGLIHSLSTKWGAGDHSAISRDLANQVVINSRIATRKYAVFTLGLQVAGAFIIFAAVALSISIICTGR